MKWKRDVQAKIFIGGTSRDLKSYREVVAEWANEHGYESTARQSGLWKRIHDKLREKVRKQVGKKPTPTAAVIDSQSVKTTEVGGEERGYDAGKKRIRFSIFREGWFSGMRQSTSDSSLFSSKIMHRALVV